MSADTPPVDVNVRSDDAKFHLLHVCEMTLRWGDMDALNHLNNTVYFRLMEQVRIDWLFSAGQIASAEVDSPVIVTASCHFIKPIVWPAKVVVSMFGGPPGRSSFDSRYEISVEGSPGPYATGTARVVWVGARSGQSVPLPAWVLEQLPKKDAP
jgi:acyl-CoA thioester hydrolase